MTLTLLYRLVIAIGVGLLIGLQRQRAIGHLAGIRTFPLVSVLGVFSGALIPTAGGWVAGAALLGLAAFAFKAYPQGVPAQQAGYGITTEVTLLVAFVLGVAISTDLILEAVVAGGAVALLLHWKTPLHAFADRLGPEDFEALMRLSLLALVILPVLPNRAYGPYQVLNPFSIWVMVVLIVGISLGGYVAFRLFGSRRGAVVAGILGGFISSTATSVGYARRSKETPERSRAAALVIVLASTVVFARVFLEILVVAPEILPGVGIPLAMMMGVMTLISFATYSLGAGGGRAELQDQQPPSDLRSALLFGLLYAVVLFLVAWAEDQGGAQGLYLVAALSGLTDMDAITLSSAQLMKSGSMAVDTGWRVIMVGGLANLGFKGCVVALLGHPAAAKRVGAAFALSVLGGVAILFFWP